MKQELKKMKKRITELEDHLIDEDATLTEEERKSIQKALDDLDKGRAISLEDLKKELDV